MAEELQQIKKNNPQKLQYFVADKNLSDLLGIKKMTYGELLKICYSMSLKIAYEMHHPAARAKYITEEDYNKEMTVLNEDKKYLDPVDANVSS